MSRWTTLDQIVTVEAGKSATAIRNVPNTLTIFDSHFPQRQIVRIRALQNPASQLSGGQRRRIYTDAEAR